MGLDEPAVADHIDSIIDQVAAGSGTIPYETDTVGAYDDADEEDTSSSLRESYDQSKWGGSCWRWVARPVQVVYP